MIAGAPKQAGLIRSLGAFDNSSFPGKLSAAPIPPMKPLRTICALLPVAIGLYLTNKATAAVQLPADAALPANSASNPGFTVQVAQASTNFTVGNSVLRALKQINGTLTDNANNLITNVALSGPNPNGFYYADTLSFERDGFPVDLLDENQNPIASFAALLFPGIPGNEGETGQFALDAVALVQLPAGETTLGISVSADRTDVNDDDGYSVFVGQNPRDFFATRIADYARVNAQAFASNQRIENQIVVNAPVAGVYPFRILYWQTGRGANLQFYRIDTTTGERILINDPIDTRSPRAFRSTTSTNFNSPYIAEISPSPGSAGVNSAAPIQVLLVDGLGATVDTNSVQLWLNNAPVSLQVTKAGTATTLRFSPDPARPDPNNQLRLVYADSNGTRRTNEWAFSIITTGGSVTTVTGQWDFDAGDLRATVGQPLAYLDPAFDGPAGSSANKTQFGTCSSLGVDLINGKDARVMRVPGDLDRRIGYVMEHGIAPNGGGTKVNQFTLIMDVRVDTSGPGAASLLQIDSLNNSNDGDLFWQGSNFGQGTGGYNGKGTFTAGVWHRVAAAYDLAANPPVVTKYVDGIKQDDWTAGNSLDAARRALLPTAILFGDGDQDERRTMWVNSIQIRSGKLTDAELATLGAPDGNPIPSAIPQSNVTGQWNFEFGDLSANIGKDLQYLDPAFDGPNGSSATRTEFGLCSALGAALIGGVDAPVMKVPGDLDRKFGYIMTHLIAPNGGGTKVNQYTLIMDVLVDTSGPGAASLLQIDSLDNSNDGDLFWQGNNFGQGTGGYNGAGTFTAGEWHRVAAAYNLAANPPVVTKFVDGVFQDDWTAGQSLDAARRALLPTAILFGDGDQDERRAMWVSSVQIRSGALSKLELEALGKPTASKIPLVLAVQAPPSLTAVRNGNQLTISWPQDATGYTLESAPSLPSATWTAVPGVVNNSVTLTMGTANTFYRLHR